MENALVSACWGSALEGSPEEGVVIAVKTNSTWHLSHARSWSNYNSFSPHHSPMK